MLTTFTAIITLALWLPISFNFILPAWVTNQFSPSPITTKPLTTPPPFVSSTPSSITLPQTAQQTPLPTQQPTAKPTIKPTLQPKPTKKPTVKPTSKPTVKPSASTNPPSTSGEITTQSVLNALNSYRTKNNAGPLTIDQKLQNYAKTRSDHLQQIGKLDNHAGFNNFIQNENGFTQLGFNSVAENQSWNYKGTADGLISEFYAKSPGHNKNQINPEYTHVGIGISGVYTNLIFAGKKK